VYRHHSFNLPCDFIAREREIDDGDLGTDGSHFLDCTALRPRQRKVLICGVVDKFIVAAVDPRGNFGRQITELGLGSDRI
jgi:hypothetical protein